ncbi:amidohydrolase [Streptomyces sp. NPDC003247]|uniref:amidohydrolase n=1 Tax=Streptomyces sp. NPDC003247 TaxID=3364677 RepID=UPI0036B5688B
MNTTHPDLVVVDADVRTPRPGMTSLAVTRGRITALDRDSLAGLAGPGTRIVDAGGAAVLPGFTDAHVHPMAAGVQLLTCDLSRLPHDLDRYRATIRAYADDHPELEWISGNGWYGDTFPGGLPSRTILDELVPDRPAVFVSHDCHGVWANSRALELAKIDDHTPDPVNGRINRDADGVATGVLVERAGDLITDLLPPISDEFAERALLAAQDHLHAMGVTGWQDACVGSLWGMPDPLPVYRRLAADGRLTARVVGALWWSAEKGLGQLDSLEERRATGTAGRFRPVSVKVMQDGVCENCTGAMLQPYYGDVHHGAGTGASFIDPGELREICRELDSRSFQIHMHAVGDRAVRECLDALEAARRANPGHDNRHQIAHLDVVHPDDVPRFAELGVIANIQALWARRDKEIVERKLPLLGPEREARHFPFQELKAAGARLAMGSDWPVTDPNPFWAIYTAATRLGPRQDPHAVGDTVFTDPLEARHALDLDVALDAYTAGSAYANHAEDEVGTITVGRRADLVVLDRPLTDLEAVSSARPVLTLVDGRTVHGDL